MKENNGGKLIRISSNDYSTLIALKNKTKVPLKYLVSKLLNDGMTKKEIKDILGD